MKHILDNPVWNALISGNKNIAKGNESVKYFSEGISPFIGLKSVRASNLRRLYKITDPANPVAIVNAKEIIIPEEWEVIKTMAVLQMVCNDPTKAVVAEQEFIPLQDQHIPEMLALTQLTNPGPFSQRTIDFGDYHGIFCGHTLVAMCGQRLHPYQYLEISAVCTHPEHHGKGYATQLILHQMNRIKMKSCIPFLHVKNDNETAIKLYKKLGFSIRKEMIFTMFQKRM